MGKVVGGVLVGLVVLVIAAAAGAASVFGGLASSGAGPLGAGAVLPSRHALADIPRSMLALYQRAAPECPGLSWTILAAIGKIETDHGRHPTMISSAGAVGPMQFLPATFDAYDQPDSARRLRPTDAVGSGQRRLRSRPPAVRPRRPPQRPDLEGAIWHYNHSDTYVRQVLDQAARYTAHPPPRRTSKPPRRSPTPAPTSASPTCGAATDPQKAASTAPA